MQSEFRTAFTIQPVLISHGDVTRWFKLRKFGAERSGLQAEELRKALASDQEKLMQGDTVTPIGIVLDDTFFDDDDDDVSEEEISRTSCVDDVSMTK